MLLAAAVAAGLAYATAMGWVMAHEVDLVFKPNRRAYAVALEAPAGITIARTLPDGRPGQLWVVRHAGRPDAPWVVYLHGNGATVATPENVERYGVLHDLGLQIVAPEYPGFGVLDGVPSEAALGLAARDAWAWLREQGVASADIAVYGWSLGSGVATDLASVVDERGVVLEGAFTGVDDRGREVYPWLPIGLMIRNRFASRERIGRLGSPLLLLHATDDQVIPVGHARRLLALAQPPRRLVELTGGHVHPNRAARARYTGALRAFFSGLWPTRVAP